MLDDLYLPDYKRLGTMLIGAPGSGKSKFTEVTLTQFLRRNQDENLRVLFACPKQEMYLGEDSLTSIDKLEKHFSSRT